jgi:hypothetical protein
MTAPLKAIDGNADLTELMNALASRARAAARVLALASPAQKDKALEAIERAPMRRPFSLPTPRTSRKLAPAEPLRPSSID